MTPAQEQEAFDMIWDGLTTQSKARPTSSPKGFVLGGQPGAGKSKMVSRLGAELNRNLLVINGDEFRRYHPNFDEILFFNSRIVISSCISFLYRGSCIELIAQDVVLLVGISQNRIFILIFDNAVDFYVCKSIS